MTFNSETFSKEKLLTATVEKTNKSEFCVILDGPRGSLRRLRSQLAEDGCPESQVVLAKQLLEERCGTMQVCVCKSTVGH